MLQNNVLFDCLLVCLFASPYIRCISNYLIKSAISETLVCQMTALTHGGQTQKCPHFVIPSTSLCMLENKELIFMHKKFKFVFFSPFFIKII